LLGRCAVSGTATISRIRASTAMLVRATIAVSQPPTTMIAPARVVDSAAPMPWIIVAAPMATL